MSLGRVLAYGHVLVFPIVVGVICVLRLSQGHIRRPILACWGLLLLTDLLVYAAFWTRELRPVLVGVAPVRYALGVLAVFVVDMLRRRVKRNRP